MTHAASAAPEPPEAGDERGAMANALQTGATAGFNHVHETKLIAPLIDDNFWMLRRALESQRKDTNVFGAGDCWPIPPKKWRPGAKAQILVFTRVWSYPKSGWVSMV